MSTLSLSPLSRLASLAPLAVRLIVGIIMLAHGWQKLTEMGPGNFGGQMLAGAAVRARSSTWP
jgi:putative oxidoreductase